MLNYEQRTQARLEKAVREIIGLLAQDIVNDANAIRFNGIDAKLKRRAMVKQIDLAAKHYDLRQEVDAYLAKCDVASVAGLEDAKLSALSRWLGSVMDRLATACDHPDSPPAR